MRWVFMLLAALVLACCEPSESINEVAQVENANLSSIGMRLDQTAKKELELYLEQNHTDYPNNLFDSRGIVIKRIEYNNKIRYLLYDVEEKSVRLFGADGMNCDAIDLEALLEIGTDIYFRDAGQDQWICPKEIKITGYCYFTGVETSTDEAVEDTASDPNQWWR